MSTPNLIGSRGTFGRKEKLVIGFTELTYHFFIRMTVLFWGTFKQTINYIELGIYNIGAIIAIVSI